MILRTAVRELRAHPGRTAFAVAGVSMMVATGPGATSDNVLLQNYGRLAGLWKDFGIALLAIVGNCVVAFSWWYVNVMGVGLHSYGFTSGIKEGVIAFWVSQAIVLSLGTLAWFIDRAESRTPPGLGNAQPSGSA